jgi:hypothetical protein
LNPGSKWRFGRHHPAIWQPTVKKIKNKNKHIQWFIQLSTIQLGIMPPPNPVSEEATGPETETDVQAFMSLATWRKYPGISFFLKQI